MHHVYWCWTRFCCNFRKSLIRISYHLKTLSAYRNSSKIILFVNCIIFTCYLFYGNISEDQALFNMGFLSIYCFVLFLIHYFVFKTDRSKARNTAILIVLVLMGIGSTLYILFLFYLKALAKAYVH